MAMIGTSILGKVLPTNKGEWMVGVQYELLDVVSHAPTGNIYLCVEAHDSTGLTEPGVQEPSKWGLLCGKGGVGIVPVYSFSEDGFSLSIENPDGSMGEAVNIRGDEGDPGEPGLPGDRGLPGPRGLEGSGGDVKLDGIANNEGDYLTVYDPDGSNGRRVYTRGANRG